MIKKLLISLIEFYQKTLSPDYGIKKELNPYGFCKYYPSCSEYMKKSIEKKGVVVGLLKGFWRILRCNPFSKGGVDLP
jgi:putative membrane protein insertion efficiency factor